MDGKSLDVIRQKIDELKGILPEAFAEDKIDWEKLQAALGKENIEFQNERYVLNWAGKSDAFRSLQQQTTATLIPDRNESVNFDTTENLFIEGENLEVLKILQKSYFGKVKMIYIDPPYNTGNDFIYSDKFAERREDYLKRTGAKDENGLLQREGLFRNGKDNGHYHSNWLSMMYPRLFLARNLLREDGVIFVSIDDNEVHNLRMIMNEVFGEENFIGQIVIKSNPRGSQEPFGISAEHEYVLTYGKSEDARLNIIGSQRSDDDSEFSYTDQNGKKARLLGLRKRGGDWRRSDRPNMFYPFYIAPLTHKVSLEMSTDYNIEVLPIRPGGEESRWTWAKDTAQNQINLLTAKKVKRGNLDVYDIYRIDYLENEQGERKTEKLKSIIDDKELNYQYARQYFKEFFGSSEIFDFPKSPFLIYRLMVSIKDNDGIILDFFSGSCTTAHAVLDLNKQDGGNRKFIMVQMPESCNEKSEAYKAGFQTIAEIGKERIRRVIKKMEKEKSEKPDMFDDGKLDLGFKVFKLSSSNFKIWRGDEITEENLETQLDAFTNPVKEGSEKENMLYELILKAGYLLTDKVALRHFDKLSAQGDKGNYYSVNDGELIIALEEMNQELIDTIISARPKKVITLDKLFTGHDQLKTNTVLQMRDNEIDFRTI